MKIKDITAIPVTVPMEAPLRWSMGIETGTTRTIIRLETDDGLEGIGETYGGDHTVRGIEFAKPFLLGMDPAEVRLIVNKLQSFRVSYESNIPLYVVGGIEMACWDVMGKKLGRPVASLLKLPFKYPPPAWPMAPMRALTRRALPRATGAPAASRLRRT